MTDDDDDWAPPPVPDGDGDPVAAADEALAEALLALRAGAWMPVGDDTDAAATILRLMDPRHRRPETPLRYVIHQALDETYPQLTTSRIQPLYLYAAVKTVQLLAAAPSAQDRRGALERAWDLLAELLREVTVAAGATA